MTSTSDHTQFRELYERLSASLGTIIRGQADVIRLSLSAFFTGGHILLEDFPGTGKTTLAKALAKSVGCDFQRIQFTPDLLPSDILGASVFNPKSAEFVVHRGPIFSEILLADEINRASPRTQSALLQAMAENEVSLDGTLYRLPPLFFVIATQNPVEFHGTYPLPEAQMDRFAVRLSLGYVPVEQEIEIITNEIDGTGVETLSACVARDDITRFAEAARQVTVSAELMRYVVDLINATRSEPRLSLGASPRASVCWVKCAQALALFDGLDFVTPDHIQELATAVVAHRLVPDSNARYDGSNAEFVLQEILDATPVPR